MAVKLVDFARKLIVERKIIRANKGNSIVPLFIIRFDELPPENDNYYVPSTKVLLLTICRKTGIVFANTDLTKLYSAGAGYVGYTDWWIWSEVLSIRPPGATSTNKLLEVNIHYRDRADDAIFDGWDQ